jgi:hypothetical protein
VVAATHAPLLAPGASVLDLAAFVADPWTEEDAA